MHMCIAVAGHLQPHCHWLLELAIMIVSAIAEGQVHVVSHCIATSIYGNCNHGNCGFRIHCWVGQWMVLSWIQMM